MITNETVAKEKLNKAATQWTTILKESDVANKKARIDKDVTISIYFNLLECYFALRNTGDADMVLSTLGRLDISNREKKLKEKYAALFLDLTARKIANGL